MNRIGMAGEVFGGLTSPAVLTYLNNLDNTAGSSDEAVPDLEERVNEIEDLLEVAELNISAAQEAILDLQQRMMVEEGWTEEMQGWIAVLTGRCNNLQDRMEVEEEYTAQYGGAITRLGDEMTGQKSAMDLAYKRLRLIEYSVVNSITGTVPLLVGQFILPTGSYFSSKANIGCSLPGDTATLSVKAGASELVSVTRTGSPTWVVADDFTLTAETEVKLWLSADTITATAIIYCIKFEVS